MPITGIIITNIITLIILIVKLSKNPPAGSSKDERKIASTQCRIGLSCSILLGMTWVFALLAVGNLKYTFQLLFCIFNSLQGFFIFILYTLANPTVRNELSKYCSCVQVSGLHSASYPVSSSGRRTQPGTSTTVADIYRRVYSKRR